MTAIARYIVIGSWAIFSLYWFVSAFNVKPTRERQSLGSRLVVACLVGIGFVLIFSTYRQRIVRDTDPIAWIGSVLSVGGLAITLWARRTLGGNWSATVT